jgi:hypothetical protein
LVECPAHHTLMSLPQPGDWWPRLRPLTGLSLWL